MPETERVNMCQRLKHCAKIVASALGQPFKGLSWAGGDRRDDAHPQWGVCPAAEDCNKVRQDRSLHLWCALPKYGQRWYKVNLRKGLETP